MDEKTFRKKLEAQQRKESYEASLQSKYRAQSVNVGKSGPGSTEISLRAPNGNYLFAICHPAEVIELVHQLAANIGCHIHIQPRQDFSSYREWQEVDESMLEHLNGWAPFPQLQQGFNKIGKGTLSLDRPFKFQKEVLEENKRLKDELLSLQVDSKDENNAPVATKKAVNKRGANRTKKTSK